MRGALERRQEPRHDRTGEVRACLTYATQYAVPCSAGAMTWKQHYRSSHAILARGSTGCQRRGNWQSCPNKAASQQQNYNWDSYTHPQAPSKTNARDASGKKPGLGEESASPSAQSGSTGELYVKRGLNQFISMNQAFNTVQLSARKRRN